MKLDLQVIRNHRSHPVPTVVVIAENRRYYFNIPELMQRFIPEHYIKFSKGSHIFFTQITTSHIAGVLGMLMTLSEQRAANGVKLYGPSGLLSLLECSRYMLGDRILKYSTYEFFTRNKLKGILSDEFLKKLLQMPDYETIFANPEEFLSKHQALAKDDINDAEKFITAPDEIFEDENLKIIPVLTNKNSKAGKSIISYICKTKIIRGKVVQDKVKEIQLPKKYIGTLLEQGVLEIEGKKFYSHQIKDPDIAPRVFVIIDCPDFASLENLMQAPQMKKLYSNQTDLQEEELKIIIHSVGLEVAKSETYKQWLLNFPSSTQHVFINEFIRDSEEMKIDIESGVITEFKHFSYVNLMQTFFPKNFPKLAETWDSNAYTIEKLFPELTNKSIPKFLVEYGLAPIKSEGFHNIEVSQGTSKTLQLKEDEGLKQLHSETVSEVEKLLSQTQSSPELKLFEGCDPELVFLGTASMMPSCYRNVSGIYLRFVDQKDVGIMLDCGEGTQFQFLNHYGLERAKGLLSKLRIIFITHKHADHHLGVMQVLSDRNKMFTKEEGVTQEPIYLVVPFNMAPWIYRYSTEIEELNCKVVFSQHINVKAGQLTEETSKKLKEDITPESLHLSRCTSDTEDCEDNWYEDPSQFDYVQKLDEESRKNLKSMKEMLTKEFGISEFMSIDAIHCQQSQSIVIGHKNGWKLVYSGDTRPNMRMVREAPNTTILIHEATFSHDLLAQAKAKKHATDKEAILLGMKMKAWRTILTHFSTRYGKDVKISGLDESEGMEDQAYIEYAKNNTVLAFDHIRFRLSELLYMPAVTKFLSRMVPAEATNP